MHGNLVCLLVLINGLSSFNRPQDIQNNVSNAISNTNANNNNNNNGNLRNALTLPGSSNNSQPQGNNTNSGNGQQKSSPAPTQTQTQNNPKPTGPGQIPSYNNRSADHDYKYYNIKNIAESVRVETCANQQSFCDNVCGYLKSTAMINDCNSDTLRWKCECENNLFPSPDNYTFPAEFVICTEDLRACEVGCSSELGCQSRCRDKRICVAKDINDGKAPVVPTSKPKTYDIFNNASRSYYAESVVFLSLVSLFII